MSPGFAGMQPPTVDQAHEQLVGALQDMLSWESRAKTAKELLKDMMTSRREAAELATKYDIRSYTRLSSSVPRNMVAGMSATKYTQPALTHMS